MVNSKEAEGMFDALARRKRQRITKISKEEMYDFWTQLTDQSFNARLQIFFDMVDKNGDGRITTDEVEELILFCVSANKLVMLVEKAKEYAKLIMEELDPGNLNYIELWQLEMLLLRKAVNIDYSKPLSTASVGWSQNLSQNLSSFRPKNVVRRVSCTLNPKRGQTTSRASPPPPPAPTSSSSTSTPSAPSTSTSPPPPPSSTLAPLPPNLIFFSPI